MSGRGREEEERVGKALVVTLQKPLWKMAAGRMEEERRTEDCQ